MEVGEGKVTEKEKDLQWHPAFFASIQIELAKEAHKLIFENEHTLSTKPMLIDVVIIKKNSDDKIQKNIGRIFRKYNIIEYKSPTDYLSVDDFYKVYGYTCFYKSAAKNENQIPVDELTITFVCKNYPYKFMEHLQKSRKNTMRKVEKGIYYIYGDIFPIQVIVTSRLSKDVNLWLKGLTNDLKKKDIITKLSEEYLEHKRDELYKSAMAVIIKANRGEFREVSTMCEAILEVFKEEHERGLALAREEVRQNDIKSTIEVCRDVGVPQEKVLEQLVNHYHMVRDEAETYMEKYW